MDVNKANMLEAKSMARSLESQGQDHNLKLETKVKVKAKQVQFYVGAGGQFRGAIAPP